MESILPRKEKKSPKRKNNPKFGSLFPFPHSLAFVHLLLFCISSYLARIGGETSTYCGMKGCSGRISGHRSQCTMSWKSPNRADSQRLSQQCWSSGKWPHSHLQELVNIHGKGELSSSSIKVTPLWLDQHFHGSCFALQCP